MDGNGSYQGFRQKRSETNSRQVSTMKRLFPLFAPVLSIYTAMAVPSAAQNIAPHVKDNINWPQFMARHDLVWERLPAQWHEGAFIGNGLLGAMIYLSEDGKNLRWDIGRSDVVDRGGRLPIGTMTLKTTGTLQNGTMRLDLWNAEATGTLKTEKGEIKFRSFTHATDLVTVIELETSEGERGAHFDFEPGLAVSARKVYRKEEITEDDKNPQPEIGKTGEVQWVKQTLKAGGEFTTAKIEVELPANRRLTAISTIYGSRQPGDPPGGPTTTFQAIEIVKKAAAQGDVNASHRAWWHAYWPQSFVSIPDTRLESFYWIQMYKLASATRADRPAIDLMGPWFRTTPWPAIWWNLNIQLTYWPVYASNRLELGESLTRIIDAGQQNLINNVPEKWRDDSAVLPRVTSYDLKGGAGHEIGNLTWALHNYWLQYRYSMDESKLRSLFPVLRRAINYYLHNLQPGDDGKLHLPISTSPEYPTDAADTNYDLSLLRWGLQTLIDSNARLKQNDPLLPKWKETLEKLTPYPVDEKTGLMIGKDVPLEISHRHFSHMLMIYPLYLMNWEQPENRALIEKSLNHWIGFKGALQGYSYTGAAAMKAQMGKGDDAAQLLNQFLDSYVKPNTMYLEAGPVIETPLAGAASLHEMLLQSWGGKIRVFPAIPNAWKDVTIHNMRAEGGFLVSASRRDGKTQWVRITSLAGEPCRVKLPDASFPRDFAVLGSGAAMEVDGSMRVPLKKGQSVVLLSHKLTENQIALESVAPQEWRLNYYGSRKARTVPPVTANADGSLLLDAAQASLNGEKLLRQESKDAINIGRWITPSDSVSWNALVPKAGRYKVSALYSTPGGGNEFLVTIGASKLTGQTQRTGDWDTFKEFELGEVEIKAPGLLPVEVRAPNLKGALFNLQAIRLVPVR
jgi:alpha-L-fucosidase 2